MFCKSTNGFTLVELMVVIAIISILAVGSIQSYIFYLDKARISRALTFEKNVQAQLYQNTVTYIDFDTLPLGGLLNGQQILNQQGNSPDLIVRQFPITIPGLYGNAIQMTGNGQGMYIDENEGLSFGPGEPFTFSLWIRKDGDTPPAHGDGQHIIGVRDGSGSEWELIWAEGVNIRGLTFQNRSVSGQQNRLQFLDYKIDTWHHVVGSYDGNSLFFYVDGKKIGSMALGNGGYIHNSRIGIGTRSDGWPGSSFEGTIDNIGIYDAALIL